VGAGAFGGLFFAHLTSHLQPRCETGFIFPWLAEIAPCIEADIRYMNMLCAEKGLDYSDDRFQTVTVPAAVTSRISVDLDHVVFYAS
jgi:hypothetical protein